MPPVGSGDFVIRLKRLKLYRRSNGVDTQLTQVGSQFTNVVDAGGVLQIVMNLTHVDDEHEPGANEYFLRAEVIDNAENIQGSVYSIFGRALNGILFPEA